MFICGWNQATQSLSRQLFFANFERNTFFKRFTRLKNCEIHLVGWLVLLYVISYRIIYCRNCSFLRASFKKLIIVISKKRKRKTSLQLVWFQVFLCSSNNFQKYLFWFRDWTLTVSTTLGPRIMTMKDFTLVPRTPKLEPHHHMQFGVIPRILLLFLVRFKVNSIFCNVFVNNP